MATRPAPSMALLRTFSPLWRPAAHPGILARGCPAPATFSTSQGRPARKNKGQQKRDPRITQIRYHLQHPLTPRPLRFSRTRALRHFTIHRAWQLHQAKLRKARELELERQYNSMAAACETLRLIDDDGLTAQERLRVGAEKDGQGRAKNTEGRMYRTAMMKTDVWKGVPIEYARIQTDTPPRSGWNHAWKR